MNFLFSKGGGGWRKTFKIFPIIILSRHRKFGLTSLSDCARYLRVPHNNKYHYQFNPHKEKVASIFPLKVKFEFYMEKRPSIIFLVIAISSLLLLVPNYHNSPNLSEIDLFSTDLNLEIDDLFDVKNHESNTFSSIIFSIEFLPGVNRFEQFYYLLSQIPSFDQNISILRC
jgi:hypothetical protein